MNYTKFVYNQADKAWYGPDHDPSDNLDYVINFAKVIGNDPINTVTSSASGVTVTNTTHDNSKVSVWITGGSINSVATVSITVTTTGGRIIHRSFKVVVRTL